MASCGKITLYILLGIIIYIIISVIYAIFFMKYDLESQIAFGGRIQDEAAHLRQKNSILDKKTSKALALTEYFFLSAQKKLLTNFTLNDGSKFSEEHYMNVRRKVDLIIKSTNESPSRVKAAVDYFKCFVVFSLSNLNGKIIFNLDEDEKKFIKENVEAIKEIGEYAPYCFTEDCAKYLTGR